MFSHTSKRAWEFNVWNQLCGGGLVRRWVSAPCNRSAKRLLLFWVELWKTLNFPFHFGCVGKCESCPAVYVQMSEIVQKSSKITRHGFRKNRHYSASFIEFAPRQLSTRKFGTRPDRRPIFYPKIDYFRNFSWPVGFHQKWLVFHGVTDFVEKCLVFNGIHTKMACFL